MGFRFQKRFRILPGVRINLSKSGLSTSLGGKGMTVNLRGDKVRTTVGIPGTGLSYSESSRHGGSSGLLLFIALIVALLWLFL
jgi:uncharacterized protein DUF4236